MQWSTYNKIVQINHSELLIRRRNKLLNIPRLRDNLSNSDQGRSSSVLEGTNFVSTKAKNARISLPSNANSEKTKHSESNPQSLNRQYKRMLNQSIDKIKQLQKSKQQESLQRGVRVATFIPRIVDKSKRNAVHQSSLDQYLDINWCQQLISESNLKDGFLPASKANKASFFDNTSKGKSPLKATAIHLDSRLSTTRRTKRDFEDYLNFIMADHHQHITICQNLDNFRNVNKKQSFHIINRNTIFAVAHLIELVRKVLASDKIEIELKSQLLRQYCHIYFTLGEKIEFEVSLSCSLLQNFRVRLREVFLLTRMFMLGLFSLCTENKLFVYEVGKVTELCKFATSIEESYKIIQEVMAEICETYSGKLDSLFNLSFKILRNMYTIEKCCDSVKQFSRELLSGQQLSSRASPDIEKHFLYLLQRSLTSNKFEEKMLKSEILLSWKHLHIPPTPYLPPQINNNQFTIVFDLEETLIHIDRHKNIILKRPGLQKFFQTFHNICQMVLFTNTSKDFADKIMDDIDPKHTYFKYRLYQQHMSISQHRPYKDLEKLGRDMKRLIAIDHSTQYLRHSSKNGIIIMRWQGDPEDESLQLLGLLLTAMISKKSIDVREHLKVQQTTLSYIAEKSEQSITSTVLQKS